MKRKPLRRIFAPSWCNRRLLTFALLAILASGPLLPCITWAEDGYRLWLRYDKIDDSRLLQQYRDVISSLDFHPNNDMLRAADNELTLGLAGLLGGPIRQTAGETGFTDDHTLIVGTPASPLIARLHWGDSLARLGDEGFLIRAYTLDGKHGIAIAAGSDRGILYGVFNFLRLLQTHQSLLQLNIISIPAFRFRVLDHWDNLDRRVERGYAGISIFDWFTLPLYKDKRYTDYARANASIGINGVALNNVNASPLILTPDFLVKATALADIFRPYGIRVYLSVNFSSPIGIGGLKTADPLDPAVQDWWKKKADEICRYIPDFGGFVVKANSEGQPGPQNYGRTHADGANMLADALAPHQAIVIWRAFVYSDSREDRAKQAYDEFKPLDGKFRQNVLVQVKNGPIDFQPREPFHPLFGAMPHTPLMLEVQITQEYLGFSNHLVYLAPLFEECLNADTYTKGQGSPVSTTITGMAGVANTGNDVNWCGHPFAQANWYAFGRLAWGVDRRIDRQKDASSSTTASASASSNASASAIIADEWVRQTFGNQPGLLDTLKKIMLASREVAVDYMTPLGLHHIMGYSHHYGPAPWYYQAPRADWNPVYFHQADSAGIGFDRTATGSNALEQYAPGARTQWAQLGDCPDKWILWWHHVTWGYRLHSGRTLWEELCHKYYAGVDSVRWMQKCWDALQFSGIDAERWTQVQMLLNIQERDAVWWRNACLLYFQTFSRRPLPENSELPDHTLEYYEKLQVYFPPGIQMTGTNPK
jgi:alpha-glucuronidase